MPTTKAKKKAKKKASSAKAAKNGQRKKAARAPRRATPKDKRQLVQERKILRSQSRWLQKALFALDKAEDDHAKLSEVRGEKHEPMAVTIDGTTHKVGAVTDSLRDSVMDRLERLRATLRSGHALMG
jgi:cation transport ATPase